MRKSSGTITFTSLTQFINWEFEISGQISDGNWENSRPFDHWKFWTSLTARFDESLEEGICITNGYQYIARKNYNLSDKNLLDVVGSRMVAKCIFAMVLDSLDFNWFAINSEGNRENYNILYNYMHGIDLFDCHGCKSFSDWKTYINKQIAESDYWSKYDIFDESMINRYLALKESGAYTMKDLRKDLNAMKLVMKNVKE